jgi:hypothetical protein
MKEESGRHGDETPRADVPYENARSFWTAFIEKTIWEKCNGWGIKKSDIVLKVAAYIA